MQYSASTASGRVLLESGKETSFAYTDGQSVITTKMDPIPRLSGLHYQEPPASLKEPRPGDLLAISDGKWCYVASMCSAAASGSLARSQPTV